MVKWTHQMINQKIQEAVTTSAGVDNSPMGKLRAAVQGFQGGQLRLQAQAPIVGK